MKMYVKLVLFSLIVLICSSMSYADNKPAQTTLVIFRNSDDAGEPYAIRNTQNELGALHSGQRIVINVPMGTHQLIADSNANQRFYIEAKSGDTLFIRAGKNPQNPEQPALLTMSSLDSFIDFAPGPR